MSDPGAAPTTDASPAERSAARFHDLDALRAFAMLSGIALHAAVPFIPYWHEGDTGAGFLGGLFLVLHGFRMPLFFILSGFFTTMLWRSRGTRELLRHRMRRVALPFGLAILTILPAVGWTLATGLELAGNPAVPAADHPAAWFPVSHLWFLWFLILMVGGFALVVTGIGRISWPTRLSMSASRIGLPLAAAVLVLAAVAAQSRMTQDLFGPDTSEGLVPIPRVFAVYACCFAWGALIFGRRASGDLPVIRVMGRWWGLSLLGAAAAFAVGNTLLEPGWRAAVVQVAYAVLASCGSIGLFGRFFSGDNPRIRWLSDSSYWLYLAHLPLVFLGQGLAVRWGLPPLAAFVLIFTTVTALLLISYRYGVRYTRLGTLLNGPRSR
ncbi:MAG: acyltransferase family protein [Kineosporiaceae bacterium]